MFPLSCETNSDEMLPLSLNYRANGFENAMGRIFKVGTARPRESVKLLCSKQ